MPERADSERESGKLIRYFLAGLTIPGKDLWVNLSPYEKDRIIPETFGQTEMGRDLLEQDYILKQLTASLLYPEGDTGKKFWQKVYALAQEKYGTTDIPIDTFNKVWIVPDKAEVYESVQAGAVYITASRLKVLLEQDYLASALNSTSTDELSANGAQAIARAVLREVVIPELEKEVNEGEHFARLRQVYQSLILAAWYKKKIGRSLLSLAYVDRNKTAGINIDDPRAARQIWERYLESFVGGVYTLLKEEQDGYEGQMIPRKYFSGGANLSELELLTTGHSPVSPGAKERTIRILLQPVKGLFVAGAHRFVFPVLLAGSMSCSGCAGLFYKANDILPESADVPAQESTSANIPLDILKDTRGRISPSDWKESLLISAQNKKLLAEVRDFLLKYRVFASLPEFQVLFVKGLGKVEPRDYIFYPGTRWFVFNHDNIQGLSDDQVFARAVVGMAHELSHLMDFETADIGSLEQYKKSSKMTVLESEAKAYRMTKAVMGLVEGLAVRENKSFYPYEALERAGNLVQAFELLTTGPTRLPDLERWNYEQVDFSDYNTTVRIYLKDLYSGQKAVAVISLVDNSVKIQAPGENPDASMLERTPKYTELGRDVDPAKGGIDLGATDGMLAVDDSGQINLQFDDALLAQFQQAGGVTTLIIN